MNSTAAAPTPADPDAFAFLTERQLHRQGPWVPDGRLVLLLEPGGPVDLSQLGWRDEDGVETVVGFSPGLTGFLGTRGTGGEPHGWRGRLAGRVPAASATPFTAPPAFGGGELRLLVDDGGAPLTRVTWADRSGGSGAVVLRSSAPGDDLGGRIRDAWAHDEYTEAGEVAVNVLDATGSKWLGNRTGDDWLAFTMTRPVAVRHYVLVSANDAPDRDPAEWVLKGSEDGLTWDTLDSRSDVTFGGRYEALGFNVKGAAAEREYRHFRLEIVRNAGSPHHQLNRVRFFGERPRFTSFSGYRLLPGAPAVPYEGLRTGSARTYSAESWTSRLRSFSADMVRTGEAEQPADDAASGRTGPWLGHAGASEEQLVALEARLEAPLPPSYRSFLGASDGWGAISTFMYELLPAKGVGRLRDVDPGTWGILRGDEDDEDDYFDQDEQDFMDRVVLVSGEGDAQYWLLDPGDVSADGEWAAYIWASWYPGLGERHASFAELVEAEWQSSADLKGREGNPVAPDGADELLARGTELALSGEVDEALRVFDAAARKGSGAASYQKVVLAAFLGDRFTHHELRGVLHHEHVRLAIGRDVLLSEAVPLFLRCAAADRPDSPGLPCRTLGDLLPDLPGIPHDAQGTEIAPAWDRWATGYRAPALPEAPAFQHALERARLFAARGRNDEAWAVVEAALPEWRPLSPHRTAPVVLLTDPVLRQVMTPRRRRIVVFTPRGGEQDGRG
ncbi:SMI1/KNR4 family protein [Streptomyces sp. NPDC090306]|uniref:SMI1/KNR4 family protein n=1 Tax=Streptomyces sp. NPDC090306 TaxID=3365961 RepID=UPI0038304F90